MPNPSIIRVSGKPMDSDDADMIIRNIRLIKDKDVLNSWLRTFMQNLQWILSAWGADLVR